MLRSMKVEPNLPPGHNPLRRTPLFRRSRTDPPLTQTRTEPPSLGGSFVLPPVEEGGLVLGVVSEGGFCPDTPLRTYFCRMRRICVNAGVNNG